MKKYLRKATLALTIALTILGSSVLIYAAPGQVTFGVTSPQVQGNATNIAVSINVTANASGGIGAADLIFTYDNTKLQLVSCTKGVGFGGLASINTDYAANKIFMAYADDAGATGTGEFYHVTFNVMTTTLGDIAVSLEVMSLNDSASSADIPYTINQGKVTVVAAPTAAPTATRAPTRAPTPTPTKGPTAGASSSQVSSSQTSSGTSQSSASSSSASASMSNTSSSASSSGTVSTKDDVIAMIDKLPTVVKTSDETAIKAVRAAYDALTASDKALVTNYSLLLSAEQQLELLNANGSLKSRNTVILIIVIVLFLAAIGALLFLLLRKRRRES